jgi:hypothetical protein
MFNKNQNEANGKKGNLNSKDTNVQTDKLPPIASIIEKFNSNNQGNSEQKKEETNKKASFGEIKAKFEPKQEKMEKSSIVNEVRAKLDPKFQAKQEENKLHSEARKDVKIGNVKETAKKFSPEAAKPNQDQNKPKKPFGAIGVKDSIAKFEQNSSHVEALKNSNSNTKGGQSR